MSTEIYGCIEIRHPHADDDWYDDEPWLYAMDLSPLYLGNDYAALACLFGVRNYAGWEPVAPDRGLPTDVSAQVRGDFEHWSALDAALHGATWVTWRELEAVDMDGVPPGAHGRLRVQDSAVPALIREYWVRDDWPAGIVDRFGELPFGSTPATARPGTWTADGAHLDFHRVTREDVIGPGSGWEHVFAVMKAMAGRFGPDGVRLVAYFD
ncbi:hypothetical protein AB0I98_35145 [Streptomyces sp. NPDC050211]|uniref:hypothetical protein n=1 Tax=Streptomyces sp. NPDC050211 TaxID=3154932 RepID=UPI003448B0E5